MRLKCEFWWNIGIIGQRCIYVFSFFTYQVCGITFANRVMREIERVERYWRKDWKIHENIIPRHFSNLKFQV